MTQIMMDAEAAMQKNVTDRWKADLEHGNWLTRSVRPLVLIFLIVATVLMIFIDSGSIKFDVDEKWTDLLQLVLITVIGSYFGRIGNRRAGYMCTALRAALRAPGGHVRRARAFGVRHHLIVQREISRQRRALLEVLARVPVVAGALVGLGALLPRDHGLLLAPRLLELGGWV